MQYQARNFGTIFAGLAVEITSSHTSVSSVIFVRKSFSSMLISGSGDCSCIAPPVACVRAAVIGCCFLLL